MAEPTTFRLRDRHPKRPLRGLPPALELAADATVEDAKRAIAHRTGLSDFNRVGLYDPSTNTTLKDRRAVLADIPAVRQAGELTVKDLGFQISWRVVYVVEYIGPILFHALVLRLRPYIYLVPPFAYKSETDTPVTEAQALLFAMFQMHFLKREFETLFVHKFSANTMPARNIVKNSAFYWFIAGLAAALEIYMPGSLAARDRLGPLDFLGIALFALGEMANGAVHLHLSKLRKAGGTEKGIPNCIGSSLVTCPNYMFEVVAWVGIVLVSRSLFTCIFILVGMRWMRGKARDKEKALRRTFGDRYKPMRYTMLPGLI